MFALAPFLDLVNHGIQPNCDFRLGGAGAALGSDNGGGSSSASASASASGMIELFALQDLAAGTEALITYTGPKGLTNQSLMALYGFVLPGGNPGDRVSLQVPEGSRWGFRRRGKGRSGFTGWTE